MIHKIKTFRADTMDEAMELVRQELGQDAVVLKTTPIATRRLIPWPATTQQMEVTAQKATDKRQGRQSLTPISGREPGQQKRRTLAETMNVADTLPVIPKATPLKSVESAKGGQSRLSDLAPPPPWVEPHPATALTGQLLEMPSPVASNDRMEQPIPVNQQELASLQTIVSRLERHSRATGLSEVPHQHFQNYLRLIESDVDDDLARDLISKLRHHGTPAALNSPKSVQSMLTALIERETRCAPPIRPQAGRREVVTFVGPTGVGKTTTLAKMAGHFHLREGLRVGLVTVDTYRVGAIEQLKTYAEILQLPMRAASNDQELRTAIDELDDVDLILIDTAGRSPWDEVKLAELKTLVEITTSDHVLLVLSLAAGSKMLSKIADRFRSVSPTSLVLTKLDEALGVGGLLSVAREVPIPVSYLTTGQDVPDQIEPAHPLRLARLILGLDHLQTKVSSAAE